MTKLNSSSALSAFNKIAFNSLKSEMDHFNTLWFADLMKTVLIDEPDVIQSYYKIREQITGKKINEMQGRNEISMLFKAYPILLMGFNSFLTPSTQLPFPADLMEEWQKLLSERIPYMSAHIYNLTELPTSISPTVLELFHRFLGTKAEIEAVNKGTYARVWCCRLQIYQTMKILRGSSFDPPEDQNNKFIHYFIKIKDRCKQQPNIYEKFLDILKRYSDVISTAHPVKEEAQSRAEALQSIFELFRDQSDLLMEFSQVLPHFNYVSNVAQDINDHISKV